MSIERPKKLLSKEDATPSMFINDISKMFHNAVRRECEQAGVSHGYHKLLMALSCEDGVTQLHLVKKTHLTAPTVSVALSKMEAEGLVRRVTDRQDLRQVRVFITEKGRKMDDISRKKCAEMEEIMMRGISDEEKQQLMSVLRKILINMIETEEK